MVCSVVLACFFFFFFQAEDGIRDRNVTGVQTCALPISSPPIAVEHTMVDGVVQLQSELYGRRAERHLEVYKMRGTGRSEERRVGKECRSRWAPEDEKKKRKARQEWAQWVTGRRDGKDSH